MNDNVGKILTQRGGRRLVPGGGSGREEGGRLLRVEEVRDRAALGRRANRQ